MDVYYDYACPYCVRGLAYLQELMPKYQSRITLQFIPVEAHPRPETYGLHTDLCAQGFYEAQRQGVDSWVYHAAIFKAAVNDRVNIEDANALGAVIKQIPGEFDAEAYVSALKTGVYADRINDNNHQAYDVNGVWAVPTFIMEDSRRLDAREGVGVSFKDLEALLKATPA